GPGKKTENAPLSRFFSKLLGDVERIVDVILDGIVTALANDNRVELRGFGCFLGKASSIENRSKPENWREERPGLNSGPFHFPTTSPHGCLHPACCYERPALRKFFAAFPADSKAAWASFAVIATLVSTSVKLPPAAAASTAEAAAFSLGNSAM